MTEDTQPLVLDLVEWLSVRPRTYAEVMEAWHTSCPRLPIWEDAVEMGFVVRERRNGLQSVVTVTPKGRAFLRARGRFSDAGPSPSPAPTA